jgi:hypothetical protein
MLGMVSARVEYASPYREGQRHCHRRILTVTETRLRTRVLFNSGIGFQSSQTPAQPRRSQAVVRRRDEPCHRSGLPLAERDAGAEFFLAPPPSLDPGPSARPKDCAMPASGAKRSCSHARLMPGFSPQAAVADKPSSFDW